MSDENKINDLENTEDVKITEQAAEQAESAEAPEVTEIMAAYDTDAADTEPEEADGEADTESGDEETAGNRFVIGEEDDEEEDHGTKASKKTTAVLITIILVLIAVIAIIAVVVSNKMGADKNRAASRNNTAKTTASGMSTNDPLSGFDDTEEGSQVSVIPESNVSVKVGQYKGLETTMVVDAVNSDDVELALLSFADDLGEYVDITDRPCANGDYIAISYVGWMNGEQFEGGTGSHPGFVLGSGAFVPGFEEAIVGLNVGETVKADINFPENYGDKSGLPVTFDITVDSIKTYVVPELTDELVAENTDCETVEEYRTYLADQMAQTAYQNAESLAYNDILEQLVAGATFEGSVDEEVNYYVDYYRSYYEYVATQYYGIDVDTFYMYMMGVSGEDEGVELMCQDLDFSVRLQYILDEIAKEEGFTVSQEEYDAAFEEQFLEAGGFTDRAQVLEHYTEQQVDQTVNNTVLRDKAEQLVLDSAVINR